MSNSLLISYGLQTSDSENYTLTFTIPDNCDYQIDEEKTFYIITVFLKPGETQPSDSTVTHTSVLKVIDGLLEIEFQQQLPDENTILSRPRIRVEP